MDNTSPACTPAYEESVRHLGQLQLKFLDLYTRHKEMVENESVILTALYLEKLGHLQLNLMEKQTEAARLKMKMNLMQAAINRNEQPDLNAIDRLIDERLAQYYQAIGAQAEALDGARNVLSHLLSEEETLKLRETFRVLCKRLHPDLNPDQPEEDKDLFIKVKAAYDLQRLDDLQRILLYLDDRSSNPPSGFTDDERTALIKHLENQIDNLEKKLIALRGQFPFTHEEMLHDEVAIMEKQAEVRSHITICEANIAKYTKIINIICDE
jgi:hypothetical protein